MTLERKVESFQFLHGFSQKTRDFIRLFVFREKFRAPPLLTESGELSLEYLNYRIKKEIDESHDGDSLDLFRLLVDIKRKGHWIRGAKGLFPLCGKHAVAVVNCYKRITENDSKKLHTMMGYSIDSGFNPRSNDYRCGFHPNNLRDFLRRWSPERHVIKPQSRYCPVADRILLRFQIKSLREPYNWDASWPMTQGDPNIASFSK